MAFAPQVWIKGRFSAAQLLVLSYAAAILVGTAVLALPVSASGPRLTFLEALFTATSAQCVTGLTVVDTGTALSPFGQAVVLALIQVGGLGIMTFSVYLFLFLGRGMGLTERVILSDTLLPGPVESLGGLVRGIITTTFAVEASGALVLACVFVPDLGWMRGLGSAVFHSVSAFCNAGFSLFGDSLVRYRGDLAVNLCVMALVTLGGLGFLVLHDVAARLRPVPGSGPRRLTLHSRLVLVTSAVLFAAGTILILLLERRGVLAGLGPGEAFLAACFESVTARTAGFNTVDQAAMRAPTLFLVVFLMFIGASPGSTGGGIKTTSLAVFVGILVNRLRGDESINLFKRTIPREAALKAMTLVLLAVAFMGLLIFLLLVLDSPDLAHEHPRELLDYVFEAVSAFATVGLTMGMTSELGTGGRLLVILMMFVGRVGLLTTAFAITARVRRHQRRHAGEDIMIG